jgi:hypothetical protein
MFLRSYFLVLGLLAVMFLASCSGNSNSVPTTPQGQDLNVTRVNQWDFTDDTVVDLMAGQHILAGTVTVSNDYDNIYVTYQTTGDWFLRETHVDIETSYNGFPTTKSGNPKVGNFAYKMSHNPPVQTYTYTIPFDFTEGDVIYFAAHAVVTSATYGTETGWAGCLDFPGNNWATYCTHEIGPCDINVPTCDLGLQGIFYYPGGDSYWDVQLFNVPDGYDVWNGIWNAYCVQHTVYAYPNTLYNICLISSYDDNLPPGGANVNWHIVTYILNHKDPNATALQVQEAIWFFTDGFVVNDPIVQGMIDDAQANGPDFVPGAGEYMGVLVYVNDTVQLLILEMEIGCD